MNPVSSLNSYCKTPKNIEIQRKDSGIGKRHKWTTKENITLLHVYNSMKNKDLLEIQRQANLSHIHISKIVHHIYDLEHGRIQCVKKVSSKKLLMDSSERQYERYERMDDLLPFLDQFGSPKKIETNKENQKSNEEIFSFSNLEFSEDIDSWNDSQDQLTPDQIALLKIFDTDTDYPSIFN